MFGRLRALFGKQSSVDPKASFLAEVMAIVRSQPHVAAVEPSDDAFALLLTLPSGRKYEMFLQNHFVETREMSPDERRMRIVAVLAGVDADRELSWEEAQESLLPVIRGATFGQIAPSGMPATHEVMGDNLPVRRSFVPFVDVMVVVDTPAAMAYVTAAKTKGWGVTLDDVLDKALANFGARASTEAELYDDLHGPLYHLTTNDSYESSRLLIPGWLASFRGAVEGEPIAIIPQRGMIFVGGNARPEMVGRLVAMADREYSSSLRNISPALYTVDDEGRVVPYVADDPAVRIAHEKLAIYEYCQQAEHLKATEEELFVAKYTVYQRDDGSIRSTASWTKTVDTLLPMVAWVSLVVENEEGTAAESVLPVPWEAIEARLTKVPALHPPRYRTTGEFPDDGELATLRARYAAPA